VIAINSTPRIIKTKVTLQKTNIKYKIECIGFFETITKTLQINASKQKANNKYFISVLNLYQFYKNLINIFTRRARLELTSSGHEPDMFPFTIPPLFTKVSRRVKAVKRAYVVCVAQVQMKEICEKLKEINFVLWLNPIPKELNQKQQVCLRDAQSRHHSNPTLLTAIDPM
jgi:hypothetical protein